MVACLAPVKEQWASQPRARSEQGVAVSGVLQQARRAQLAREPLALPAEAVAEQEPALADVPPEQERAGRRGQVSALAVEPRVAALRSVAPGLGALPAW
jgi:hypothetical protein